MAQKQKKTVQMPMPTPQAAQRQPNAQDLKEQRFQVFAQQFFTETIYKPEWLHEDFYKWKDAAFSHFSDAGLKMPVNAYINAVSAVDHTYEQFNIVIQILFMANAHQLQLSMQDYVKVFKPAYMRMSSAFSLATKDAEAQARIDFDKLEEVIDTTSEVGQA